MHMHANRRIYAFAILFYTNIRQAVVKFLWINMSYRPSAFLSNYMVSHFMVVL